MSNLFIAEMVSDSEGKLSFVNPADQKRLRTHGKAMRPGQKVKMVIDFTPDDGRLANIARVHAIIGEISKESFNEFEVVKKEVKTRAGLILPNEKLKSFGDCSNDELVMAINAALSLQEFLTSGE